MAEVLKFGCRRWGSPGAAECRRFAGWLDGRRCPACLWADFAPVVVRPTDGPPEPNVASIFGIEDGGGSKFLVMQLAEEEDLSERLKMGAIPVREATSIARQIAEALEAAHEKRIIRRDLGCSQEPQGLGSAAPR